MNRTPRSTVAGGRALRILGIAGVLVAILFAYVGYTAPDGIPWRSHYTLRAEFRDADNLADHAQVRMGGELVGQVLDPRVEDGLGVVDLQLDARYRPLRGDTVLRVRPRSAIGVRYVEIVPGRRGRPLSDGATISAAHTGTARALDEVLDTFDPPTRRNLTDVLRGLGGGFAGRGEDVNATLGAARPFVRDLGELGAAVNRRRGALRRLVAGADTLADAGVPVRFAAARTFDPASETLRALRAGGALGPALTAARRATGTAAARLGPTRALIGEIGRLAEDLRPGLRAAPVGLRRTTRLLRLGGPALHDARRTLVLAAASAPPTVRLLRGLRPLLPDVTGFATSPLPLLRELGPRRCDLQSMFGNWADSMAYGNNQGNYLRLSVFGNLESVGGQTSSFRLPGTRGNGYPAPCVAGEEVRP